MWTAYYGKRDDSVQDNNMNDNIKKNNEGAPVATILKIEGHVPGDVITDLQRNQKIGIILID